MATYVLVHGGWCASWCWDFNVKVLEKAGHNVICVDLPGHGDNQTIGLESITLKDHVNYVKEIIANIDVPVILVAHSMSGMIISQVAEDIPKKIEKLVYFAAFLPEGNVAMTKYLEEDIWSAISPETTVNFPNGLCTFVERYARNMGFNTSSDDIFRYSVSRMQLENPTMWSELVNLGDNFKSVPKYYIHTLKDNCCTYYIQRVMCHRQPVVKEYYLDSDHVGMLSNSEKTNEILLDIAK